MDSLTLLSNTRHFVSTKVKCAAWDTSRKYFEVWPFFQIEKNSIGRHKNLFYLL